MSGKHFKITKTLVSGLVIAVMMFGSIQGAFAFGGVGLADTNVTILSTSMSSNEVIVSSSESNVIVVGTTDESAELYKQNNKPVLRNELEKTFETIRTTTGKKVGVLYKDSSGKDNLSPSYFEALGNKGLKDMAIKKETALNLLANNTFNDVSNEDWFASYIPLASYYNLLNGYEDGTFKGNNLITAGEVSKVLAVALDGTDTDRSKLSLDGLGTQWYNSYYNTISKVFPYSTSNEINNEYMNKSMTRAEIAYTVAKIMDNGKGELEAYMQKAYNNDVNGHFNDLKANNVCYSDGTLANEQWHMREGRIPQRFAGAIMYLRDKGIMIGDNFGNCNALSGVTRGECIALVQRVAFSGITYTSGEFKGTGGTVISKPTETDKQYKYSLDTVVNPEADKKYQYTIADLRPNYGANYLLQGGEKLESVKVSVAYSEKVINEVRDSVTFENGVIRFTLPDIKSDYHEVVVRNCFGYKDDNKEGFVKTVYSSKDSGEIVIDTLGADYECEMFIMLGGKHDKQRPCGYSYAVTINFITGEIEETRI